MTWCADPHLANLVALLSRLLASLSISPLPALPRMLWAWMRQRVQANVRSLGVPRATQEIRNNIGSPPDVLHLLKVELRQELTQQKDTGGRRFLLKQMPELA